jgi:hypothetical protein
MQNAKCRMQNAECKMQNDTAMALPEEAMGHSFLNCNESDV